MIETASDSVNEATLRLKVADLEARLDEAEETLDAIRNGEVDAVIVGGPAGRQVYTLESADRPYRILIEQMQEGAVTLAVDGTVLYCNRRLATILNTPLERVIGSSILDYVPCAEREAFDKLVRDSAAGGRNGEFTLRTGEGSALPIYLSLVDLPEEGQRVLCGIVTDLTQQKQRRIAEESLQIALEASEMGSWDLDLATDTARRSFRHDQIFGYENDLPQWGREIFLNCVLPEDREAAGISFVTAVENGILEFECRITRANDGVIRWIRVKGRTYYESDKAVRMAGVVTDITEQKLLEDQLRQAMKMEAVGQLTGGLAHDFNNLLTVILGNLDRAKAHVMDERLARQIDQAQQAAERGAGLTKQLLAFSRRQSLQPRVIGVNELLPGLDLLIRRAVGERVELRLIAGNELWHCQIDPNQLGAALLNLAINARDAMPTGGALTIETANIDVAAEGIIAAPNVGFGRYVRISVTDTGEGMSPKVMERAFEPFFTTKDIGKGSGLGLSMVYGFVRQSNGHITIDSELGRGTTIRIYLPWAEPVAVDDSMPIIPAMLRPETATVLVVDDDADVRQLVVQMVADLGHRVIYAGNGSDALALLEQHPEVNLLFSDVVMPNGMSGIDVAHEARRLRPDLAVLLASGFVSQSLAQEEGLAEEFRLMPKPYRQEDLADAIGEVLAKVRQQPARKQPGKELGWNGLRVLVIEDESLVSMMLEDILEELGCQIVGPIATLKLALEKAASDQFDVALLDVNLGEDSVYPVAELLLARSIPFAFMSGHDSQSLAEPYGKVANLSKPYTAEDVKSALAKIVATERTTEAS